MPLKPQKLNPGATVAILSPSWGGPSVFPHIYEEGIKALEELGLKIKEFPSCRKEAAYLKEHPEFRAKDINDAFADPEVKAIFASIGGDDSVRLLPLLDTKTILSNPKIIMGCSDTTTLLNYLNQLGLVTFHGPTIMAGFSQWNALGSKFQEDIKTFLFNNPANYTYRAYDFYCDGYPDWADKKNLGKVKQLQANKGWNWLQGDSVIQGELFGGNIEVLEFMKATKFWPSPDFWNNKILFLETSEEKPSPLAIKRILRNYGMQGVFNKITALLFGRSMDYSQEEKQELDSILLELIGLEFKNPNLPIISNMDFGHTDPQWILPLGIKTEVDCQKKEFKLIEKVFQS